MLNYPLIMRLRNLQGVQFKLIGDNQSPIFWTEKPTTLDSFEKFSIAEIKISILLILQ